MGVLGPVEVDGNGELSPRDRVVLSVLVVHGTEVVATDRFADALWGDEPPASAAKVVQGCVVRLRKALGAPAIETHSSGYRLALGEDDIDLHRFERLLGRAREQLALRSPDRALRTAEEALALWRGRPFDDVDGWDAARAEAVRLEELRAEAEELRLDAALRAGRHHEVLALARGMVDAAPTRERRWELLALAQYRSGGQADALRTLQEARRRLVEEVGLEPGAGILALERAILDQDDDLRAPAIPAVVADTCPWPGLLAYVADDVDGFAGREPEVSAALGRLASTGVVVVVGPSGCGKSSLVRAGIAGKLQRDGRRVVVVTPGARPVESILGRAVGPETVLVVDQCEEVVTACDEPAERDRFFDALADHAADGPLVVAMRADRLGAVSGHPGFARLVEQGLFLLGPMDETSLRAAIERPALAAGLLLEPGLVDLIVRDVLDEPGALPLMSHALQQTWMRREGRTLTVAGYRETGGIRSAVAQSAEAVYDGLDDDERSKLRDLLLRLVIPLDDGAPARTRLPRRVIAEDPGYQRLVDQLVDARLLTTDGEAVELAHEALARAWPRFQDWQAEDSDGLRMLRHLDGAAAGWDALGRPDSELYRGQRLAGVVDWRERARPELTAVEEAFLEASISHQQDELRAAEAQVASERRSVRRLRHLVAGVAALALVAAVATVVAVDRRDEADAQAQVAAARQLSAEALDARPYHRALLLAVEAVRRHEGPETLGALLTTIGRSPQVTGALHGRSPRFLDVDVSPDGARLAATDDHGDITVFDLATRRALGTIATEGFFHDELAFSPDGRSLAVATYITTCQFGACDEGVDLDDVYDVAIYDVDDLDAEPVQFHGIEAVPTAVAWSPDGRYLASGSPFLYDGANDGIAVWEVAAPEAPILVTGPRYVGVDLRPTPDAYPESFVAFAADGTAVYASGAGPVSVHPLDRQPGVAPGPAGDEVVFDGRGGLALSRDGATLAVRSTSLDSVQLLDTATGEVVAELVGHDDTVLAAAFDEGGGIVATAAADETVMVWDATTGERIRRLVGHAGAVMDVAFGPSGDLLPPLYSAGSDRSVLEWTIDGTSGLSEVVMSPHSRADSESTVFVSPTGDALAILDDDVELLVDRGDLVVDLPGTEGYAVSWASFSPDGRRLATVGRFGEVTLWDAGTGEELAASPGRGVGNYGAIAFAPDRERLLVADADGVVRELDGRTLEPTGRDVDLSISEPPMGIRVAPDGRFAVTWSPLDTAGGTTILFGDIDDERIDREVHVEAFGIRAAFSADGSRYAYGGFDGTVGVVDVASGEVRGPGDRVHAGPVSWVAFSPDGHTLATLGFDGYLTLAEGEDARPRAQIRPSEANLNGALSWGDDGTTVLIAYRDGSMLAFDTRPASWIAHACAVAGRELTAGEWRDAFGDEPQRPTCE